MNLVFALLSGLIFGIGLIVSGMTDPAKVKGFLDIAGAWDPSLALVMGGAIGVGVFAFAAAKRRTRSFLGLPMQMPVARHIDRRLVIGSLIFGIGWGLAGICPGPALVLVGNGVVEGFQFAAAMVAGMVLFELFERRRETGHQSAPARTTLMNSTVRSASSR